MGKNTEETSAHNRVASMVIRQALVWYGKSYTEYRKFCCLSTDKTSANLEAMVYKRSLQQQNTFMVDNRVLGDHVDEV